MFLRTQIPPTVVSSETNDDGDEFVPHGSARSKRNAKRIAKNMDDSHDPHGLDEAQAVVSDKTIASDFYLRLRTAISVACVHGSVKPIARIFGDV